MDEIITHAKINLVAHTHTKTDKITGKGGVIQWLLPQGCVISDRIT